MEIAVENLTKYYGSFCAVDGMSFSFQSGKITAIVGRNGSGKTTTIRSLLGLIPMDSGKILVDHREQGLELKHVGYLAEERGMFPKETVQSQLLFLARLKGMSAKAADQSIRRWLERLEIPQYQKSKLESLSKGNQQKIQMIASLVHDPEVIIFDEPFSGLDPVNMQMVIRLLQELRDAGKCILVSSHQLPLIEQVCEDICIINRSKRVYYGPLEALKARYGERFVRFSTAGGALPTGLAAEEVGANQYKVRLGTKENPTFHDVLQKLVEAQVPVDALERSQESLQEIFLNLVGEEGVEA